MTKDSLGGENWTSRDLGEAVRRGGRMVALAQVASQVVSLGTLAILYRLLSPREFGLIGMVLPVLLFVRIFAAFGLGTVTVQRRDLSSSELSALFWLTMVLGLIATSATVLLAPAAAWFFTTPRLTGLTIALAGTTLLLTGSSQHQALLERKLQLGRLAAVRLVGQAGGAAAAIAAALAGWQVWALVAQQYVELILLAAGCWLAEPWRPGPPRRGTLLHGHLRFGGFYAASSLMYFLSANFDKILIGRLLGAPALGLYGQAFSLMMKPVYLVTTPLTGVMLGALSRAAGDKQTSADLAAGFYRLVAVLLLPVGVGLFVVGRDVMWLLGGEAWEQAGQLLAVLALAILAQGFINMTGPIFTAAGRTDLLFLASILVTVVLCQGYLAGWWLGTRVDAPVLGVAWGYALTSLLALLGPLSLFAWKAAGLPPQPILASVLRPGMAAIAMGLLVSGLHEWLLATGGLALPFRLAGEITTGMVIYYVLARQDIRWLVQMLRKPV